MTSSRIMPHPHCDEPVAVADLIEHELGRPRARHRAIRPFSHGPPPNRAGAFRRTRLSRASLRNALPRGPSRVDGDVAVVAGDQSLAVARSHLLDPGRNRSTAMLLEILQVAHVVDLHAVVRAAQLAGIREQ